MFYSTKNMSYLKDDESCIRSTVIAKIKSDTLLASYRRLTVRILSSKLGISKNTVYRINEDGLHMSK